MNEEWRDILGYEGYYQVSQAGAVRSLTRVDRLNRTRYGKILKVRIDKDGYHKVELNKDGVSTGWFCHRLVMLAFVGPAPDGYTVNHKNGNKQDNGNLEYLTRRENSTHSIEVLGNLKRGRNHPNAKLTEVSVAEMKKLRQAGETYREIGLRFGVSLTTAHAAINGQNWGWLG